MASYNSPPSTKTVKQHTIFKMETISESQLISRQEVMRILRIKSEHALSYHKHFKIIIKGKQSYYDKSQIVKVLGTDFIEPFLDVKEASEYLGITEKELLQCVLKKTIPFYALTKLQGNKKLFKKHELDLFKNEPHKLYLTSHNYIATKTRLLKWFRDLLLVCEGQELLEFLSIREKEVVLRVASERTLEDIGSEFELTRERVRQIFDKATRRMYMHLFRSMKQIILKNKEYENEYSALKQRNKVMEETLSFMSHTTGVPMPPKENELDEASLRILRLLKTKLVDLDFSVRALNALNIAELVTVADLVRCNRMDILKFRNFGKKSLLELEEFVATSGLQFGMDINKYGLPNKTNKIS